MNRAERVQRMLALIDERLDAYSLEETVERLNSYQGGGPTVREYFEGVEPIASVEVGLLNSADGAEKFGLELSSTYFEKHLVDSGCWESVELAAPEYRCAFNDSFQFDELSSIDVSFLAAFSYPESGCFLMGEDYRVEGTANDTSFRTDTQEGFEYREAA